MDTKNIILIKIISIIIILIFFTIQKNIFYFKIIYFNRITFYSF